MENKFDAIVIGTGISGGWAAKELTEKGLKTMKKSHLIGLGDIMLEEDR